jgi:hypothetical protein
MPRSRRSPAGDKEVHAIVADGLGSLQAGAGELCDEPVAPNIPDLLRVGVHGQQRAPGAVPAVRL